MKHGTAEIMKGLQPALHILEYDARYYPAKSPAPRLARLPAGNSPDLLYLTAPR